MKNKIDMKNTIKTLLITAILMLANTIVFSQTAREISEKASHAMEIKSMEMASTIKIIDQKGRVRVRKTVNATKEFEGVTKSLVRFTAPADVKGTAMLIFDYKDQGDDMWIYLPALRKTRRIVSSEKGKSFMGSEFSNADLTKPNLDDFEYKILSSEARDGKKYWLIESRCKDEEIEDENGYSKRISWIEKETFLVHKMEFYDLDEELHKIQYIKDFRIQSSGKYFAFYMEKENVQNGRKSIMIIDQFQAGSTMTEPSFTAAMLSK